MHNNANVIRKHLPFLLVAKAQVLLILQEFGVSFFVEGNTEFQSEVGESKDGLFFLPWFTGFSRLRAPAFIQATIISH